METVSVKLLSLDDTNKLFDFEVENRLYFEAIGLSRSEAYYDYVSFEEIVKDLVKEQDLGVHFMYLITNEQDEVVGRINLTDIIKGPLNKAELGYRIGEKHQGKGYATAAA